MFSSVIIQIKAHYSFGYLLMNRLGLLYTNASLYRAKMVLSITTFSTSRSFLTYLPLDMARVDRLCGDTCPYVCPQTGLN